MKTKIEPVVHPVVSIARPAPAKLAREAHVVVILMVDPYGGEFEMSFSPELIVSRPGEVGKHLMESYLTAVRRQAQPARTP